MPPSAPLRNSRATKWTTLTVLTLAVLTFSWRIRSAVSADRADARLLASVRNFDVEAVRVALNAGGDPNMIVPPNEPLIDRCIDRILHHNHFTETDVERVLGVALTLEPDDSRFDRARPMRMAGHPPDAAELAVRAKALRQSQIVELLLERGANPNLAVSEGMSPLGTAILQRNASLTRILLEHGASATADGTPGHEADRFPLVVGAAYFGDIQSVRALLDHGADVNQADYSGETALMAAGPTGDLKLVALLLARHADTSMRDKAGRSAWDYVFRDHYLDPDDKQALSKYLRPQSSNGTHPTPSGAPPRTSVFAAHH